MGILRQIAVATRIGLSTLRYRIKGGLVIVVGIGFMVFVLISILSIAEGAKLTLLGSGDPGRVRIYATGGAMRPMIEEKSVSYSDRNVLPSGTMDIVARAPDVARAADGSKLVDREIMLNLYGLRKRNNDGASISTVLGVGPYWQAMTPAFRLLSGRMPRPGARELIAGDLARRKFSGLDGGIIDFLSAHWRIVGVFTTGDIMDGFLIGDMQALEAAINHPANTSVLARLAAPDKFDAFRQFLQKRLASNIVVVRETDSYAQTWKRMENTSAVFAIAYALAGLIGSGAIAATMLTMRVSVEDRAREIAILRAIGFGGFAVAASVVMEAMLFAAVGGVTGAALVWLWLDGFLYNAGGVIIVRVDQHLLLVGVGWALAVALIGAISPVLQVARQTPIEALREA